MDVEGCPLPEGLLYDLEHEVWWKEEPGGTALVGVVATLGAFAGPFREFQYRPVDGIVGAGRSVATIVSVRFTGAVRVPVDVSVVERNPELPGHPRLLNDAPYTDGWVVRVRPVRPGDRGDRLEGADAVRERVREQIRARRIRCWPRTPEVEMVEIGLECSAVLAKLDEEIARRTPGDAVLLVTDDPTSPIEMVRWTDRTGHAVLAERREGELRQFLVQKLADPRPRRRGA